MIISKDEKLEIFENNAEVYEITINYEAWRVAIENTEYHYITGE